tara:strand:+ start:172 stop:552 length:381 start_codon:yes stop_codon:yes gene_type:complete
MRVTRNQLRRLIKEELSRLNETTEKAMEFSNLSPQKKQEWHKLEAALKPFGYKIAPSQYENDPGWPFAIFRFKHISGAVMGMSDEELIQQIKAERDAPGRYLEIRIPRERYEEKEEEERAEFEGDY